MGQVLMCIQHGNHTVKGGEPSDSSEINWVKYDGSKKCFHSDSSDVSTTQKSYNEQWITKYDNSENALEYVFQGDSSELKYVKYDDSKSALKYAFQSNSSEIQ